MAVAVVRSCRGVQVDQRAAAATELLFPSHQRTDDICPADVNLSCTSSRPSPKHNQSINHIYTVTGKNGPPKHVRITL